MAKKVKGRKRHIVTDTEGSLLAVLVQTANVQDKSLSVTALPRLPPRPDNASIAKIQWGVLWGE
jgi:hypothetical protein